MSASTVELLKKEAELLEGINHENIVKFKHVSLKRLIFLSDTRNKGQNLPGNGTDARWSSRRHYQVEKVV
jgi:hypothetical protein